MYRILISDKLGEAGLRLLEGLEDVSFEHRPGLAKEELLRIIPEFDALIVRSGTQVDADVLEAGGRLVVVGRAGMGVDNIDVGAATKRGIIVMNTPTANSVATAEQTMALMLAVCRHTVQAHQSLSAGDWQRSRYVGTELHGKTLGLVGFGNIGRLVARRAQAFGMHVIACDPFVSEDVGREYEVTLVDLEDLLSQADVISLHAALVPESTKMINRETIRQMKDGVIVVNVARGKLVDEVALAEALRSGKVKAAAVDVYASEPPPADNPMLGLANVVHTPHLGASTVESQRAVATQIVDQVVEALRGTGFRHNINMPFPAGPDFATIQPYMALAEKLGALHASLAGESIRHVEIEVHGEAVNGLVRAIAAALLKGLLSRSYGGQLNYINAPALAAEMGITTTQTRGKNPIDYPNLISCSVGWEGGTNLLAGMLFGGKEPRVVRLNQYALDARPEGIVLLLQNEDVPGVIGQVGTQLAAGGINIGEWRMGRDAPGGEALSFISLDSSPSPELLQAIENIGHVTQARLVSL